MKKAPALTFILLICLPAFSSFKRFEKGFIVLAKGDTVQGLLKNTNKVKLCQRISIKTTTTPDSVINYTPRDISGFYFSKKDQFFKSLSYKHEQEAKSKFARAFGKRIFNGNIKLYKLHLSPFELNGIKYTKNVVYVLEKDSATYTLSQTRVVCKQKEQSQLLNEEFKQTRTFNKTNNKYIGALNYVFRDCPDIKKSILKVNFNDDDIIGIIKDYLHYKTFWHHFFEQNITKIHLLCNCLLFLNDKNPKKLN